MPHLAGVMDTELWFSRRCIKFIKMALSSDNIIVRTITNVGLNGTHSIMGGNWRHWGLNMKCNVMLWKVGMKSVRMSVNLSEYVNR